MGRSRRSARRRRMPFHISHPPSGRNPAPEGPSRRNHRKISFYINIPIAPKQRQDRDFSPVEAESSRPASPPEDDSVPSIAESPPADERGGERPPLQGFEAKYRNWFREARRRSCSGAVPPSYSEKIKYKWEGADAHNNIGVLRLVVLKEAKKLCICYSNICMIGTVIKAALPAVKTESETFSTLFKYGRKEFNKLRRRTLWENAYKLAYSWLQETSPNRQMYHRICTGQQVPAAAVAMDQWLGDRFNLSSFHEVFDWCRGVLDDSAAGPTRPYHRVRLYLQKTFSKVMAIVGRVVVLEMALNPGRTWAHCSSLLGPYEWKRATEERKKADMEFFSLGVTNDGEGPEWHDFPWTDAPGSLKSPAREVSRTREAQRRSMRESQQRARAHAKNPKFKEMTGVLYLSRLSGPHVTPSVTQGNQVWHSVDGAAAEHAAHGQRHSGPRPSTPPPHPVQQDRNDDLFAGIEDMCRALRSQARRLADDPSQGGMLETVRMLIDDVRRDLGPVNQQAAAPPSLLSDAELCSIDPALRGLEHRTEPAGQAAVRDIRSRSDYPTLPLDDGLMGASLLPAADSLQAETPEDVVRWRGGICDRPVKRRRGRPGVQVPGTSCFALDLNT